MTDWSRCWARRTLTSIGTDCLSKAVLTAIILNARLVFAVYSEPDFVFHRYSLNIKTYLWNSDWQSLSLCSFMPLFKTQEIRWGLFHSSSLIWFWEEIQRIRLVSFFFSSSFWVRVSFSSVERKQKEKNTKKRQRDNPGIMLLGRWDGVWFCLWDCVCYISLV